VKRSLALDSSASTTGQTPASTSEQAATPSAEHDEPEEADLAETSGIAVLDRIFPRVLLTWGKLIDEFAIPVELLEAIRDALKGNRSLLFFLFIHIRMKPI
jgi:hypothetical protein